MNAMEYYPGQEYLRLQQSPNSLTLDLQSDRTTDIAKTEAVVPDSCNLLSSSMLMVNGIDLAAPSSAEMGNESWPITCSTSSSDDMHKPTISSLTTPPPDSTGFPPSYPYPWTPMQGYNFPSHAPHTTYSAMAAPGSLSVAECYLRGSSLDDSPLSSPGSCNDGSSFHDQKLLDEHFGHTSCPSTSSMVAGMNRSRSPLISHVYGAMTQSVDMMATVPSYEYAISHTPITAISDGLGHVREGSAHKAVKMPQRKGGIQLWQFMYSLLTDPDKKYSNIIEWTANVKEREFRMLEPEAIAVWWGHHKNKPNMSYDKFSRSLRYYYDKGILKKIPGERYVYRFLIDPEHMYRHIGISECRPKLKPMPQAAKLAMTKHHVEQSTAHSSPIVTPAPEPLMSSTADNSSPSPMESLAESNTVDIKTCTSTMFNKPPPPYTYNSVNALQVGGPIYSSASTGNLTTIGKGNDEVTSPPIKRSRSLDCPTSGGNVNPQLSQCSPSAPSYGQMSPTCDDFSPLPQLSAESSFLDNPMLLATQGGPDPIVSDFNFVTCATDMNTQTTSAGLFTQQSGSIADCKTFPSYLHNHSFCTQWN